MGQKPDGREREVDCTAFLAKASVDPIGISGDGEDPQHHPELGREGKAFINWCWPVIGRGHSWREKAASHSGLFPKWADNKGLLPICTVSSWERKSFLPKGVYGWHIRASTISRANSRWETCPSQYCALSLKNQYSNVWGVLWNFNSGLIKPFGLVILFSYPVNIKTCKLPTFKVLSRSCKLDTKTNLRHGSYPWRAYSLSVECRNLRHKVKQ